MIEMLKLNNKTIKGQSEFSINRRLYHNNETNKDQFVNTIKINLIVNDKEIDNLDTLQTDLDTIYLQDSNSYGYTFKLKNKEFIYDFHSNVNEYHIQILSNDFTTENEEADKNEVDK